MKKRRQQVDRQMSNLKGSTVKPEFLGPLENLAKEESNAAMTEKFSNQDSAMLQQANKLAYLS